jgi:hypothetical protein
MIREFLEKVYNQKRRHSALGTEIMPFPHSVRRTETGQSNQSIARRLSVAISTRHFSGLATTRQVELRDRQFVQPPSCCANTTAYLSPSRASSGRSNRVTGHKPT